MALIVETWELGWISPWLSRRKEETCNPLRREIVAKPVVTQRLSIQCIHVRTSQSRGLQCDREMSQYDHLIHSIGKLNIEKKDSTT